MKKILLLLLIGFLVVPAYGQEAEESPGAATASDGADRADATNATEEPVFPPQSFPEGFYDAMMKRSPFILPSFDETVAAPTGWAQNLSLVSILLVGGEEVLLVADTSTQERFRVRKTENAQGIRLVELTRADNPRETSATLAKDGQQATIRYDDSILTNLPTSVVPNNPALLND